MDKKNDEPEFETIIQPTRSYLRINWKELWHYQDLLWLLVRRDFISKYKQTVLGPIWFVLQPLLTTLVFTIIFGKIAKLPTDEIPPMLFYLCGLLAWDYFSQCVTATSTSLTGNMSLFSKVYFPRLIIPLSIVFSNLMKYGLQLCIFIGFYFYFKLGTQSGALMHPQPQLLFLPVAVMSSALISLGAGLWVCAMTVKYRDFQHLVGFSVQLWLYATPVIYPMSMVPEKWKWLVQMNPMSAILEYYRYAFFGSPAPMADSLVISAVVTLTLFLSGLYMFNKVERTFVDTI